jgi:hypothetical protein
MLQTVQSLELEKFTSSQAVIISHRLKLAEENAGVEGWRTVESLVKGIVPVVEDLSKKEKEANSMVMAYERLVRYWGKRLADTQLAGNQTVE